MASYKFVPLPEDRFASEEVHEAVENLSARESDDDLRSGTLPETYEEANGISWFTYAKEEIEDIETLDGIEEIRVPEKNEVVMLDNGYLAFEKCNKKTEQELLTAMAQTFTEGYALQPVEFEEDTLRQVLGDANSVLGLDVAPKRPAKPNKVSARDTKLEATDFPEEHDVDPFEKVKVDLPGRNIDVAVGFDRDGTVILYTRAEMHEQVRMLRLIAENIINEYLDYGSFQTTLGEDKE